MIDNNNIFWGFSRNVLFEVPRAQEKAFHKMDACIYVCSSGEKTNDSIVFLQTHIKHKTRPLIDALSLQHTMAGVVS